MWVDQSGRGWRLGPGRTWQYQSDDGKWFPGIPPGQLRAVEGVVPPTEHHGYVLVTSSSIAPTFEDLHPVIPSGPQGDKGDKGDQGDQGVRGATWFTGQGAPDDGVVVGSSPGDYYLDVSTGIVSKLGD